MYKIEKFVAAPIEENCFLLYKENKKAYIIDPGNQLPSMEEFIDREKLKPQAVLLTHGHADHWLGAEYYRNKYKVDIYVPLGEKALIEDEDMNFSKEISGRGMILKADKFFSDGDYIDEGLKVMATPGHSPGSVCFIGDDFIISGDTLFRQGVGRWDLPGGALHKLINSIGKILDLSGNKRVYPGHGPESQLDYERINNPFVPYIKAKRDRE